MAPVSAVNTGLGILTIITNFLLVLFILIFLIKRQWGNKIIHYFGKHALLLAFIVALTATLGSLFYSEIAGYEPCKLCWYERILMYPQVILLGIALFRKDKEIAPYSMALSAIGILIAGYHYAMQRGLVAAGSCTAVGYSEGCAKVFVMTFGYITIPFMAFSAFALILGLMFAQYRCK